MFRGEAASRRRQRRGRHSSLQEVNICTLDEIVHSRIDRLDTVHSLRTAHQPLQRLCLQRSILSHRLPDPIQRFLLQIHGQRNTHSPRSGIRSVHASRSCTNSCVSFPLEMTIAKIAAGRPALSNRTHWTSDPQIPLSNEAMHQYIAAFKNKKRGS